MSRKSHIRDEAQSTRVGISQPDKPLGGIRCMRRYFMESAYVQCEDAYVNGLAG